MSLHRILIVEDERIVALNLQQRLINLGYQVVGRAASGAEALATARKTQPDLVLMDIRIEGTMDGIETAALLLQELKLRVVYLTAYSEESTLARARATRPYGYLIKPFSERELHATLQMALECRAGELALAGSEERGRLALETATMGSWELTAGNSGLRTYGLAAELLGDGSGDGSPEAVLACIHQEDRALVQSAIELVRRSEMPGSVEFRQIRPDRPLRWVRLVMSAFRSSAAVEPRILGVAQDVSDRHATDSRLRLATTVFEETREGLFILDGTHRLISANPAFALMTGIEPDAWVGRELPFLSRQMMSAQAYNKLWNAIDGRDFWRGELHACRPGGALFPAYLSLSSVHADDREGMQVVGILSDFTELRATQEALRHLAHYDPLTGLPNRLLLQDRLEHAVSRACRGESHVAVLFLDLDHFKRINDTRGHAVGDLVLREVAARIQACLRDDDTAARVGGDEFVVILENFTDRSNVTAVAEKLCQALLSPLTVGGQSFHTGSSIGIALFPEHGRDAQKLLQCADTAMYQAKAQGRNAHVFYNPTMTVKVARDLARDHRLRRALAEGELRLHYQPQIDVASGRCNAVEALLRWQHPERGMLGAAEIVPAAEEIGLIVEIGRWVLFEACRQARRWQDLGYPSLRMAVNVSALQMQSGTLYLDVAAALGESGLDPQQLEIEITESSLQTESVAVATLKQIRELGVSVAIDDFGTGYSCLSSLKHLPLDRLKIDRSFVSELPGDAHSVALAETILAIASRMNLEVVAEGVETPAQLEFLRLRGCQTVQGWLYSPAIAGDLLPGVVDQLLLAA